MKGWELFSWLDATTGTMRYSLLMGTNRLKTEAEVTSPAMTLSDVAAAESALRALAPGQAVIWGGDKPLLGGRRTISFAWPAPAVEVQLTRTARALGLVFEKLR